MSKVYQILDGGATAALKRVRCVNEDLELQKLLEQNPDLLPGDQIAPEDPRRWLLIKREMPVPDPGSGADRWSIDFLFLDQDAMPTFVECKRYADTRARREVVGQMLEYAANGHHYWDAQQLRDLAANSAANRGLDLDSAISNLRPNDDMSIDTLFARCEANLRQAQVRIVFFMEESPFELRSLVDFLNKQMERTEVLLVEARQYESSGRRIVVPTLFGFTEQARLAKRTAVEHARTGRRQWNEESFFAQAAQSISTDQVAALQSVLKTGRDLGCEVSWGTGKERGSFSLKQASSPTRSFLTVYTDGTLSLNFGFLDGPGEIELRDHLRALAKERLPFPFKPDLDKHFPSVAVSEWGPRANIIAALIRDLATPTVPAA